MQKDKVEREQAILAEKAKELEKLQRVPEIKIEPSPKKEEVSIVVDGDKTESEADNEEALQKNGILVKEEFYQNQTTDLEKQIEELKKKMVRQNEEERIVMLNEALDVQTKAKEQEAVQQPIVQEENSEIINEESEEVQTVHQEIKDAEMKFEDQEEEAQGVISQNLAITAKMEVLVKFQQNIDSVMNMLLLRQHTPTFRGVKNMVEKQVHKEFTKEHLQQILHVAPFFYNHKWESKFGTMDLILSVPKNIEELMNNNGGDVSEDSFAGNMSSSLI